MRLAYADPPYPGRAHLYKDHPDYAGEVDHAALIAKLTSGYDRERVIFAELKSDTGTLRPDQLLWMEALQIARAEWHLWLPPDWTSGRVEQVLRSRHPPGQLMPIHSNPKEAA